MKYLLIALALLPYWSYNIDAYFDEYGAGWDYFEWSVAMQEELAWDYFLEQDAKRWAKFHFR